MTFRHVTKSILLGLVLISTVHAQQDFSKVEIKTEKLTDNIYVLFGAGGNIGVSVGNDGVFVIDDQYAPLTDKILAAIKVLSEKPVRFVINTHWHGDHTGGNENMGKAGAVIVAHENVRKRMSTRQVMKAFNRDVPPSPHIALPVITFTQDVAFHLNGDEISAMHVPHAHTDGDTVLKFGKSNIVHLGDTFFNGMYPFIDTGSGGSIDGIIASADKVLGMVDDNTKIIPGHGPITDKSGLQAYRDMLDKARASIKTHVNAGKSLEETVAARPTAEFDETWGKGFMTPDRFTSIVYMSLSQAAK
ncbi:MAG: MBL fold metallo-hydrolase [Pseudomonadota bacterium]